MLHTILCYTVYGVLALLNLLFTGLAYVLAPVLPLFARSDGYLPSWLDWFQTQDNSLDAGWKVQGNYGTYLQNGAVPTGLTLYYYRVLWLWRNPAYGFCYWPLGLAYNPADWLIDTYTMDGTTMAEFKAHTVDGRYFCHTKSTGLKLGYKLWWALGSDGKLLPTVPADMGPDNRIPLCFTPTL